MIRPPSRNFRGIARSLTDLSHRVEVYTYLVTNKIQYSLSFRNIGVPKT